MVQTAQRVSPYRNLSRLWPDVFRHPVWVHFACPGLRLSLAGRPLERGSYRLEALVCVSPLASPEKLETFIEGGIVQVV